MSDVHGNVKTITIIYRPEWDEYEVPDKTRAKSKDGGYFTDDKEDAMDTARTIYGNNVKIKFKTVKE